MNIYFITNKTASRVWRMIPQAQYMQSLGHEVHIDEYAGTVDENRLNWADLIITEMVFDFRILRAVEGTNKKIIYEADDLQEKTHKKHYAHKSTSGYIGWKRRLYLYYFMSQVDAIIVTNERLRKRYSWLTKLGNKKKVFILPNYMDMKYWDHQTVPNQSGRTRILWAGGSSHTVDLEFIKPVMKRIIDKYDDVDFVYMGHGGWSSKRSPSVEFNYGKDIFKDFPKNRVHLEMGTDWKHYPKKLSLLQCDIGIAPVVKNKFATMKTPIKVMEYGINNMPTVASQFLYKDAIIDGETGYLCEDQEDFYAYLCELIESPDKRKEMAKAANTHIKEKYDLSKYINQWKQVFESVFHS